MTNEITIIDRVLSGSRDDYAVLVDRYRIGLVIHCENLLGNRQDAEDVAQNAFLKAYVQLADFEASKGRFSTWLYRIATNLAIDHLRRSKRVVASDEIERLADTTAPAEIDAIEKAAIRQAVATLEPPKYSQVLQAYYWQGKSYQELADEFATTTGTISTWMSRAKAKLREELA